MRRKLTEAMANRDKGFIYDDDNLTVKEYLPGPPLALGLRTRHGRGFHLFSRQVPCDQPH